MCVIVAGSISDVFAPPLTTEKMLARLAEPRRSFRALQQTRDLVGALLQLTWKTLLWPAAAMTAILLIWRSRHGARRFPVLQAILSALLKREFVPPELDEYNWDLHASVLTLGGAAALYGIDYSAAHAAIYVPSIALMLLIAVVARQLFYILVPGSLLQTLRLASARPQIQFFIVFLCDLSALGLLLPVVAMQISPAAVSSGDVWEALRGALPHQDWLGIITGADLSRRTILISGAGLIFDAALLSSLFVGVTVGRTDRDMIRLAEELTARGQVMDAHRTLNKVTVEDVRSAGLRIHLALLSKNIEGAKRAAELQSRLLRAPTSTEAIYMGLSGVALIIGSGEVWKELLHAAIRDELEDAQLAVILMSAPWDDDTIVNLDLFGGEAEIAKYVEHYSVSVDLILHVEMRRGPLPEYLEKTSDRLILPDRGAGRFVHIAACRITLNRDILIGQIPQFANYYFGTQLAELEGLLLAIKRLEDLIACHFALLSAALVVHMNAPRLDERCGELLSRSQRNLQGHASMDSFTRVSHDVFKLMKSEVDADQESKTIGKGTKRASLSGRLDELFVERRLEKNIGQLRNYVIQKVCSGPDPLGEARRIFNLDESAVERIVSNATAEEVGRRLEREVEVFFQGRQEEFGSKGWREVQRRILLMMIDMLWTEGDLTDEDVWFFVAQWVNSPNVPGMPRTEGVGRLAEAVTGSLMRAVVPADDRRAELQPLPHIEAHYIDPRGLNEPTLAEASAAHFGDTSVANETGRLQTRNPSDPATWGKVARNAPCPCGSGKKYKECHGQHD